MQELRRRELRVRERIHFLPSTPHDEKLEALLHRVLQMYEDCQQVGAKDRTEEIIVDMGVVSYERKVR